MAVSCPRCGNLVEQDFGVATCVHCQAVLFVNMDGYAQITEDLANQPAAITPEQNLESASEIGPELDLYPDPIADLSPEMDMDAAPGSEPESESEPESIEIQSETGIFESTEQVLGAISYSIKIENIDTKEVRLLVIKALDDIKFQWDSGEIMRSVKDGAIELKNLNPVKASVVVQRVRDLPVKISWKQNVYN